MMSLPLASRKLGDRNINPHGAFYVLDGGLTIMDIFFPTSIILYNILILVCYSSDENSNAGYYYRYRAGYRYLYDFFLFPLTKFAAAFYLIRLRLPHALRCMRLTILHKFVSAVIF